MNVPIAPFKISETVVLGGERPLIIAGPCVVESESLCMQVAESMLKICQDQNLPYVFKASFDKANRTSSSSFRSIGLDESLNILRKVKEVYNVPVLTDIHETHQAEIVGQVADVLQIPAFLCRQTDLLIAAGKTGRAVNIKKGQFMAPEDMKYAVEKVASVGNQKAFLTERGTSFGYHNLVVDMRSLPMMRHFSPVVFDVTHSIQMPGGLGGSSGGQREFAPYLARAAAAVGVDGFFMETHPDPGKALSDGPNMVPLAEIEEFIHVLLRLWEISRSMEIYLKT